MKRVTIKDIAAACGVSHSTVSLVLNDKTDEIGSKTVVKVREMAKEMGYYRNNLARSLVTKTSNTFAVLIPDITNPFYANIVKRISEKASEKKYSIYLCDTNNNFEEELNQISILDNRLIDGIIVASRDSEKLLSSFNNNRNVPIVILDEYYESNDENIYTVTSDILSTSYKMANHLIDNGHTKILTLTGSLGGTNSIFREKGIRKAFDEHNIEGKVEQFVLANYRLDVAYKVIMEMQDFPYTAVICLNDLMAYGVIKALNEKGLKVPEDVAVVGFDSNASKDIVQSISSVKVTSYNQNEYQLAEKAIETLFNHVTKNEEKNNKMTLVDSKWVKGTTS